MSTSRLNTDSWAGEGKNPTGGLSRVFSTLAGRDKIWACYFDIAVRGSSDNPWPETQKCSGFTPQHLHNIFLESHLLGGWLAAIALLLAMTVLATRGFLEAVNATSPRGLLQALFSVGLTVTGIVVGLTESFIYWEMVFGAVVLFSAPPVLRRKLFRSRRRRTPLEQES